MATNRQVAYLAAAQVGNDDPNDVKNRAEAHWSWLQSQSDTENAQYALLASSARGLSEDPNDIHARATGLLGLLAGEPAGNGT